MKAKLERRIKRTKQQVDELESKHRGNESEYTYHGGFDLGYLKGKLSTLEIVLDDLEGEEDGKG